MDFTYQPVERYRAIMALLFFFLEALYTFSRKNCRTVFSGERATNFVEISHQSTKRLSRKWDNAKVTHTFEIKISVKTSEESMLQQIMTSFLL